MEKKIFRKLMIAHLRRVRGPKEDRSAHSEACQSSLHFEIIFESSKGSSARTASELKPQKCES
jgi:hypothetical protein